MTNPQLGFQEMAQAQAQPHVIINQADRSITASYMGEISIVFPSDADYTLQATDPLDTGDEWPYGTIVATDPGVELTTARSVLYPDLDPLYGGPSRPRFFFVNDTLQDLTIKLDATGSAGVTVLPGQSRFVRYDGNDIVDGQSAASPTAPVVELAGDTYTLADLTVGAWHEFTNTGTVTITVEDNATEAIETAAEFGIMAAGGAVELVAGGTAVVIVAPRGGTLEMEQGDFAVLKRRDTDLWKLIGESVAA